MNNLSTQELFDLLKSRILISLGDNRIKCPTCNGLRMKLKAIKIGNSEQYSIEQCFDCHNGTHYVCEYCGKTSSNRCQCLGVHEANTLELKTREQEKRSKAIIVKFSYYKGWLTSLENEERVIEPDDFACEYLDDFTPESPKFVWAMNTSRAFNLDLDDIIQDRCEDQWEGLYDNLNTRDTLILQAQVLLDEWLDKEDPTEYSESSKVLVDLSELYEQGMKYNQFNEGE